MRKIANIVRADYDVRRAMIFECADGVYVFTYATEEDGPCTYDYLFDSLAAAGHSCAERYGIDSTQWKLIADPLPGCQHDWIAPVRVKRDKHGKKLWGQFESLPTANGT